MKVSEIVCIVKVHDLFQESSYNKTSKILEFLFYFQSFNLLFNFTNLVFEFLERALNFTYSVQLFRLRVTR